MVWHPFATLPETADTQEVANLNMRAPALHSAIVRFVRRLRRLGEEREHH